MRKTWMWAAVATLLPLAALAAPKKADRSVVRRGEYLVNVSGCNDCHTPWKMGPQGPQPDVSRLLSGHPEDLVMPRPPAPVGPWVASGSGTFTAWAGPWGVSFAANLTPDPETGMGKWTKQNFVDAMRTGRHMGRGRPILPPMPAGNVAKMTDADLSAVFAYFRSIPPIRNRVPEAIAPETAGSAPGSQPAAAK
jgi:hypothetical protein